MQIEVDLKMIQYMLTIEREGSFQKAAKALYISQPALSQYVRRTEEALSFPLYERQNGRCFLTRPGRILLERGRRLLADYEQMISEMREAASVGGEVRFGWPTGYTARYFSRLFMELSKDDSLESQVMEGSVERLLFLLLQGRLDIAFVPAVYVHPDLEYTTIHREEFYLAVPKAHEAGQFVEDHLKDGRADLRELKHLPFVTVNARPFTEFLMPLFGEEDRLPNQLFSCKDWDGAYQLADQGMALTVLPGWYAEKPRENISFYPIASGCRTYRVFACVTRKDAPVSPQMHMVMERVMQLYGDQYAGQPVEQQFLTLPYSSSASET